jgi:WD40 repeat protein
VKCSSAVAISVFVSLGLWVLVAGCTLSPSTVSPSMALPTEVPVSPTPSQTPSATPEPTSIVPVPPPIATETTWLATPAERLSGQIAVSLYSLALIDLQGGSPKFLGPHPPTYSQFSWAPDGSKLAYLLLGDLWVVDVETHQTWNLTYRGWYNEPERWELMPNWSPDGRYIAFTSRLLEPREYGQTEGTMQGVFGGQLTIIGADGSDYRVLDKEAVTHNPRWAPDSQRLIYASSDGQLYIFDLESGQRQQLPPAEYGLQDDLYFSSAAWSPKGNEIAISFSTRPRPEDMSVEQGCAILNLKDHTSKILKRYTVTLLMPYEGIPPGETLCCGGPGILWSPSGDYILVDIKPLPRTDLPIGLSVIDTQGKQEVFLTGRYGKHLWVYSAAWSPDGLWVAYVDGDDRSLWVFNPFDPAEKYQIMGPFCCEGPVAWRPNKRSGR